MNTAVLERPQRSSIQDVGFANPVHPSLGIETLTLQDLQTRASAEHLASPARPDFSVRVLYTAGQGRHVVDFVAHPVSAGTLITVRAGQVHQFMLNPGLRGRLIIVDKTFVLPRHLAYTEALVSPVSGAARQQLTPELADEFTWTAARIESDTKRYAHHPLAPALLRQRLHALLLLTQMTSEDDADVAPGAAGSRELLREFERLVERHYAKRWSVQEYAVRLGYAEKTLTRACLEWMGKTAKCIVDDRVVLEAKRSLAHSDETVAVISHRLGFNEPTNFVRFFRRREGKTPSAFKAELAHSMTAAVADPLATQRTE